MREKVAHKRLTECFPGITSRGMYNVADITDSCKLACTHTCMHVHVHAIYIYVVLVFRKESNMCFVYMCFSCSCFQFCTDFLFGLVTEQVVDGSTVHSTDYSFYNWIGTYVL